MREDIVRLHLGNINVSKSAGPGKIHQTIIEPLTNLLAGLMCKLYMASLERGYLTQDGKTTLIVAIQKSDSRSEVGDYMSVGQASVLCKVPERTIRVCT